MKRILVFCLTFLLCLPAFTSCADDKITELTADSLIGAWRSENLSNSDSAVHEFVYAFAENGQMLALYFEEDELVLMSGYHYQYDEENSSLVISESGFEDGKFYARLNRYGDLILSDFSEKSSESEEKEREIVFYRESVKKSSYIGEWVSTYTDADGESVTHIYRFTEDGKAVSVEKRGSFDITADYQNYSYTMDNGILHLYTVNKDGTLGVSLFFYIAFPYDGYMTVEPFPTGENAISPVRPYMAVQE